MASYNAKVGEISNIDKIKGSRALKWCDYHKVNFVSKECPLCRGGEVAKVEKVLDLENQICSVCKIKKELSEFHINKDKKNGHSSTCKECQKVRAKIAWERKKLKN